MINVFPDYTVEMLFNSCPYLGMGKLLVLFTKQSTAFLTNNFLLLSRFKMARDRAWYPGGEQKTILCQEDGGKGRKKANTPGVQHGNVYFNPNSS